MNAHKARNFGVLFDEFPEFGLGSIRKTANENDGGAGAGRSGLGCLGDFLGGVNSDNFFGLNFGGRSLLSGLRIIIKKKETHHQQICFF